MHKQRLIDIKSKASTRLNNSVPRTLKYQNIKHNGYVSQEKERKTNIVRENQKIFQIMEEISSGRRAASIHQVLDSVRGTSQPRSLNLPSRIKEAQRIIDDNNALAKRLNETNRGVSFQKFDEDWQNTTKYMNSISKKNIRKLPTLENYSRNLPSIASADPGSKKGYTSRSPLSSVHKRGQSGFSPNLTTPLPASKMKVNGPEEEIEKSKKGENFASGSREKMDGFDGNIGELKRIAGEGRDKGDRSGNRGKGVEEIKENDVEASVNSIENLNELNENKIQIMEKASEKELSRKNISEISKQELQLVEKTSENVILEKSCREDSKNELFESKKDMESLENSTENNNKKSLKDSELLESGDKLAAEFDNPELNKLIVFVDENPELNNEVNKINENPEENEEDYSDEYNADDDAYSEKIVDS